MQFGHKRLYIDGQLVEAAAGATRPVICPADESTVATIAWAGAADTRRALAAAERGFRYWSALPLGERQQWMDRLRRAIDDKRDLLRQSIMHEMGKVWAGTAEDLDSITDSLRFYATEMEKRQPVEIPDREGTHHHRIIEQPLGVVVAFLAYNFPLLNLGFKLGPALAAGCSIILKPSELSPLSAYILGEICDEIGFPAGVINIICGDVAEVGVPLCESTVPRLITMIGSTQTAQHLIRQSSATSLKRYSMECGGNAPFIVCEDANLDAAVGLGVALKVGNAGQICVAPNRFFIHESHLDSFIEGMTAAFADTKLGFGPEEDPDMGPLVNRAAVEKVDGIVREALAQGGELVSGGELPDGPGFYYPPTLVKLDDPRAPVLQREIFGPVALVTAFSDPREVLALANDTEAGLASYVFSNRQEDLDLFSEGLEFGEVQLNGVKYAIYLPHGGVKNSGIGVDCSTYALDDYLVKKRVSTALSPA
ncbi:succinate-semialdehyde dehydrogenase/glutarate-semialdehyde dehydrogenase [Lewinella marina]|uniref:NAD-dependent succinate-semialdehyde dehydrogenase n=1 Tax=Neolewinella marina TaxID=438751 RepID=A0A2G0CDM5_9BACT|nr:aldehyde dehydrogenase family protein [Neolewinella marina]NJB85956.1 succinate-semialdehyde dehydrogenase/glutarate-semialdehyde dehydrogenase [Neolewinella marina]PHK98073.1 NAD-dependent succinate-semialdehyde dehydrogenase [Neolewinella marina]